jgi:hypothetical protein
MGNNLLEGLFALSYHKWDTVSPTVGRNMCKYVNGLLEEVKIQRNKVRNGERTKERKNERHRKGVSLKIRNLLLGNSVVSVCSMNFYLMNRIINAWGVTVQYFS